MGLRKVGRNKETTKINQEKERKEKKRQRKKGAMD
jgi:hypothetical protein